MKKLMMAIFPAATIVLLFAACGSNNGSSAPVVAAVGSCTAGYVYNSSYGCLSQGSCQAGYGSYNGTCVPATQTSCGGGYGGTTGYYPGSAYVPGSTSTYGYGNCTPGMTGYSSGYPYGYPSTVYPVTTIPIYPATVVYPYGYGYAGGGWGGYYGYRMH